MRSRPAHAPALVHPVVRITGTAQRRRNAGTARRRHHPLSLQPGDSPLLLSPTVQHAHAGREAAHPASCPQRRHGHLQRRHHRHGREHGATHRIRLHTARAGSTVHPHQPPEPHPRHTAGTAGATQRGGNTDHHRPLPLHQPDGFPPLCRRTLATEQGGREASAAHRHQLCHRGRPADNARLESVGRQGADRKCRIPVLRLAVRQRAPMAPLYLHHQPATGVQGEACRRRHHHPGKRRNTRRGNVVVVVRRPRVQPPYTEPGGRGTAGQDVACDVRRADTRPCH